MSVSGVSWIEETEVQGRRAHQGLFSRTHPQLLQ